MGTSCSILGSVLLDPSLRLPPSPRRSWPPGRVQQRKRTTRMTGTYVRAKALRHSGRSEGQRRKKKHPKRKCAARKPTQISLRPYTHDSFCSSQFEEANTNGLYVVDHAVLAIANEFRFTGEEVKEYYDKCGDMNRTRDRFRRMRQWLADMPDDDVMPPPAPQSQPQPQHPFPGIPAAPPPELAQMQT